jgi:hypothetical protein
LAKKHHTNYCSAETGISFVNGKIDVQPGKVNINIGANLVDSHFVTQVPFLIESSGKFGKKDMYM